jgi:hypothetical protein
LWGAVTLLRDHLEDRKFLSGSVSATRDVLSSRRGPTEYKITVGIDEINLTSRMAPTIRIGDRIRAEIGRGSHYAYKIEKLP